MYLTVLGINHRTAPVELRGQVAFPPDKVGQALAELRALDGIHEAAILSTCNRTELYCAREETGTDLVTLGPDLVATGLLSDWSAAARRIRLSAFGRLLCQSGKS